MYNVKLDQLNTNACGVCQHISWDDKILDEMNKPTIKRKVGNFFRRLIKKKEIREPQKPYCTLHKELVSEQDWCLHYKPKKQFKVFGSVEDEEVKMTKQDQRGNYGATL